MHRQERWSVLLLCILLPAILLPAAQKQDKTTSLERDTVEGAKIFQYRCAVVMELMDEGTDQTQLSYGIRLLT